MHAPPPIPAIPPSTVTVARALELPALRRGLPEVLAGADRLDRPVRWVHAGEAPHIAALLKGGELLLTTGLGLGARPAEQRAFVRALAERDIAALVVELGTRLPALPAAVVDAARAAGLPLVQLHREVPFVAVTEEVHTELVNAHYALLRRADGVHRRCTEALLDGGGAPEVLRLLADFTANPVFLEAADGRLLYAAGPDPAPPGAAEPLQVWDGLRRTDLAGRVTVDVPGQAPGGPRARLTVLPVHAPLAPVHRAAADRTAGLLAVVLLQARQEEELAARGRGDFLTDLAEGRLDPADAPALARVLGFRPGPGPLLPVVLGAPAGPGRDAGPAALTHAVQEELAAVGVPVLLGVRLPEGRIPLLAGLRDAADRPAVADRLAAALRAGARRVRSRPPVVVVGSPADWTTAGGALRHAAEAATAAAGLPDRPWYDARALDVDLLLSRLRAPDDLASFVDRVLGPLLTHDTTARTPLLPTLDTYLRHAGRKAETARELHVNRQTLYDRLARIASLLGTDPDEPEARLALGVALRGRRLVG
ncbi:PucR family transcriptional regulator [Streptomyces mobaraensis NBRC 13819 = DSM 40847]|uniref:PucR family transcriptional regulator n=2 Tax=Streptomyces mobaraensis TaxID=35621 RepID=A0A5N5VZU8_STRMB|nr:PucR family transcriptional regulator [Streptomyces mobaraensis]KAB7833741.1 PucR family transcriptional regulator [Streptomyces mobaraensis]QTT73155.1 PucR family transcriptional regulator [Streptomyces mobaraensis NBRC 13819 = DSM 40847]